MKTMKFSQLSASRQFLIRLCQQVNYGLILDVRLADGDVHIESLPEVVFDIKLDGEITERFEVDLADFELPDQICRLMAQIDSLKNGVIERIVVHEGLPRRVVVRGSFKEVHR